MCSIRPRQRAGVCCKTCGVEWLTWPFKMSSYAEKMLWSCTRPEPRDLLPHLSLCCTYVRLLLNETTCLWTSVVNLSVAIFAPNVKRFLLNDLHFILYMVYKSPQQYNLCFWFTSNGWKIVHLSILSIFLFFFCLLFSVRSNMKIVTHVQDCIIEVIRHFVSVWFIVL